MSKYEYAWAPDRRLKLTTRTTNKQGQNQNSTIDEANAHCQRDYHDEESFPHSSSSVQFIQKESNAKLTKRIFNCNIDASTSSQQTSVHHLANDEGWDAVIKRSEQRKQRRRYVQSLLCVLLLSLFAFIIIGFISYRNANAAQRVTLMESDVPKLVESDSSKQLSDAMIEKIRTDKTTLVHGSFLVSIIGVLERLMTQPAIAPGQPSIREYMLLFARHCDFNTSEFIHMLMLIDKFLIQNPKERLTGENVHALIFGGLMLAHKLGSDDMLSSSYDHQYSRVGVYDRYYSRVSGFPLSRWYHIQKWYLMHIDWNLHLSQEEFKVYATALHLDVMKRHQQRAQPPTPSPDN